ncbi:mycofactocin-coupled SDR family oxidoreductase [Gordonia sp. FQ]|uniref:mycofactocin-coupled SDR family oxidoreductase n=1 Tax=Gordonia sp. FQ TaxID=3446634 RepID=UPI003F85597F
MTGKLDGKVAFITGAARGQGRTHALALAAEGADIIAVDLCAQVPMVQYPMATPEDLAETVREVEALGRRIVARQADVRDLDALKAAVDAGVEEFGRLDIVVANAGISHYDSTLDMDEETWQTMLDINLTGVWKTLKVSVPRIRAGGRGGSVILTSSLAVLIPTANIGHYSAAKGALVQLCRSLAKELAPESIRVNTVHPGTILTDMVVNDVTFRLFRPDLENPTRADFDEVAGGMTLMPTKGLEPEEISRTVVYLASDDSRYVTGRKHVIDAGQALM